MFSIKLDVYVPSTVSGEREKLQRIISPLLKQVTGTGQFSLQDVPSCRGHSLLHHLHAYCLLSLSAPGGVSLTVPQPNINATVAQNILLSVEYSCRGVATVEWKHVSSWGTTKIVEWKSGNYVNISAVYKDRVTIFENGSIQLLNVGMRDAGYYFVTVTEEHGTNTYGTIIVNVYGMNFRGVLSFALCLNTDLLINNFLMVYFCLPCRDYLRRYTFCSGSLCISRCSICHLDLLHVAV